MRLAKVIGTVVLNRQLPDLPVARYLLVRTCNRGTLAGENGGNDEVLVAYDDLGSREGDIIGLTEGREATAPFHPKRVPYDCYNAAIMDKVYFEPLL
jgi:microcompartment protein CcmK/EutM